MVIIVDLGTGNLRSLRNAMEALDLPWTLARGPEEAPEEGWTVLPGVGAFGHAAERLSRRGWPDHLRKKSAEGGRILGICLGMQLLFESSEESPGVPGLALLPGGVRRLDPARAKVPHIGWARLRGAGPEAAAAFPPWAYFVHSYAAAPRDCGIVLSWADHGAPFPAAIRHEGIWGVQFHPEKSQTGGLAFLKSLFGGAP